MAIGRKHLSNKVPPILWTEATRHNLRLPRSLLEGAIGGVPSLTLLAFGVAGQGVDIDTGAESLRSVILTLVLKHEPAHQKCQECLLTEIS